MHITISFALHIHPFRIPRCQVTETDSLNVTVESDEETDSLNVTVESNDGSLYVQTPQRKGRERIETMSIVPSNICFVDLKQLDKFIKQVNQIRCATPGCKGALCPIHAKSVGLGGALSSLLVTVVL